ncbi:hypothetical protein IKQ26_05365 [bacterium]|nr:hypothetical protein [bacterium]
MTLENILFDSVRQNTPEYIKNLSVIDLENKNEFVFRLKKEHLREYDEKLNPEGLNLNAWLKNYEKEARVSTAGIRGPQNVLWCQDSRFPINLFGILLSTYAKALVAKEKYPSSKILKLAGREVRYNSDKFLELIARVQAGQGIETLTPFERKTIPIWLASFLAFKLDLYGGEYITSSHGISVKNATKDLNNQGSQYLPEESMAFVGKLKEIFSIVEEKGYYDIKIASDSDKLINDEFMKSINDGIDLYVEYLKSGVASDKNLNLIKTLKNKIVVECVGGSAYRTLSKITQKLGIFDKFDWLDTEEDSFFHSIGKVMKNGELYDYSVDATVMAKDDSGKEIFPVIETMNYKERLKNYPLSTVVLITDPDNDRLTVCQIESKNAIRKLEKLGINYSELDGDRILCVYSANQSFLLIMDYWLQSLKNEGKLNNHPRFIIKTTASSKAWDEWAKANGVKSVNVPVGFKEIASVIKKVEKQIKDNPSKSVVVTDVYGNDIDLGINPRLIFAGEESGGMIIGPEELIESKGGRKALAMREKSAAEAILVSSALAKVLENHSELLSDHLNKIFEDNKIISKFDVRVDISYYNETEPNIEKLMAAKKEGEEKRTKNDLFFLTLAIAKFENKISVDDVREIFKSTFPELNFDNLTDIKFTGDGTYLDFTDKFIEIRPSGTDAKTKGYGGGENKADLIKFASVLGNYSGDKNSKYIALISEDYYNSSKKKSIEIYDGFSSKDEDRTEFQIPDYLKTLGLRE